MIAATNQQEDGTSRDYRHNGQSARGSNITWLRDNIATNKQEGSGLEVEGSDWLSRHHVTKACVLQPANPPSVSVYGGICSSYLMCTLPL